MKLFVLESMREAAHEKNKSDDEIGATIKMKTTENTDVICNHSMRSNLNRQPFGPFI